ncbi:VPA1269 family protein [Devosia sp. Root685]|uniref:VPA1269 family protein n=1 Tax=Devosia sp. Root685 TaxID=1736587 RepID=UPI000AA94ABC|nr:VPA1269 family protein [Devosia sp. Root685]
MNQLALIEDSISEWKLFALSLDGEIKAADQKGLLTFTKAHQNFFANFQQRILEAVSIDSIQGAVENLLLASVETMEGGFSGGTIAMRKTSGTRLRTGIFHVLHQAREMDLILFPLGHLNTSVIEWLPKSTKLRSHRQHSTVGSKVLAKCAPIVSLQDQGVLDRLFDILVRSCAFQSTSDLNSEFFEDFWNFFLGPYKAIFDTYATKYSREKGLYNKLFKAIFDLGLLPDDLDSMFEYTSAYFDRIERNEKSLSSTNFNWVGITYTKVNLSKWAEALSWWVHHRPKKTPANLVTAVKPFVAFLGQLNNPPPAPEAYTRSHTISRPDSPEITFLDYLKREGYWGTQTGYNAVQDTRRFFEDWHDHHGMDLAEWSPPIRAQDHPVIYSRGKTNKEILPVRIIRLMKEVLTAEDYAWPKTQTSDYINYSNPETGEYEKVWCPVRAIAIQTLLTLPIRTVQLRMEDSGEADDQIYDPASGQWLSNDHPLATPGRSRGFWTPMRDHATGKDYVGIHVTTNKTAAIGAHDFEEGYDIPWDCAELKPCINQLMNWQRFYNPVAGLLSRKDFIFDTDRPSRAIKNLYGYTFLFRDPASSKRPPNEPVSYDRLATFFGKLLEEVERRFKVGGEDVSLVTYDQFGNIKSPYTLHGLRAAGITHFVEGGVPIQVIAEFIAGHAHFLMTLHYTRLGPSYVTDTIDRALQKMEEGSYDNFERFLRDSPLSERRRWLVGNSDAAFQSLADISPGLWSTSHDGICPNGRALCHIGGEVASTQSNAYYGPVPGGPRNCPLCRFWMTGPEYLEGQLNSYCVFLFKLGERAQTSNQLSRKLAELVASGAASNRQIERVKADIEAITIELNIMVQGAQERARLILQSWALRDKIKNDPDHDGSKFALITRLDEDELELVFEETTYWDQVDFAAHAFEFFPQIGETSAPLRKGRLMDQLLKRNGYQAFFFNLPEDEALHASNSLTRLLQGLAGRSGLRSLVEGEETLESLGLVDKFENTLKEISKLEPLRLRPINGKARLTQTVEDTSGQR